MTLQHKIAWTGVAIAICLFGFWLILPTINKWRADRLVDELCAKEGGIRVHETIELPGLSNGSLKRPHIVAKRLMKNGDQFYYVFSSTDIRGSSNSSDISALTIYRTETTLYRAKDDKLLGVAIGYARRGGDPIGPWHPSSYRCPSDATTPNLIRNVLVEKQR